MKKRYGFRSRVMTFHVVIVAAGISACEAAFFTAEAGMMNQEFDTTIDGGTPLHRCEYVGEASKFSSPTLMAEHSGNARADALIVIVQKGLV